jgi:hypothetical protein
VTDKGQASVSLENLSNIAPPVPGLAEATRIAPERKASPLPSPTNELSSPSFPPPNVVVSDHPGSPATLIPATDGSSTRPTKGGIAYPFSLKVDDGQDANASMVTLQSVGITTPPAVDLVQVEKELGAQSAPAEGSIIPAAATSTVEKDKPGVERFYTAGAGLFSSGAKPDEVEGAEKVQRPSVERFETAQEDLSALAGAQAKI